MLRHASVTNASRCLTTKAPTIRISLTIASPNTRQNSTNDADCHFRRALKRRRHCFAEQHDRPTNDLHGQRMTHCLPGALTQRLRKRQATCRQSVHRTHTVACFMPSRSRLKAATTGSHWERVLHRDRLRFDPLGLRHIVLADEASPRLPSASFAYWHAACSYGIPS